MNLVSIVVPVYNAENYLTDCVDSIRAQSYQNIEILLVDDGSTDTSASLCDQLGQLDPRIRVIHNSNHGVSNARNTGLDQATGEYILFVDSDDTISRNLVRDNLEELVSDNSDISLFGFQYVYDTVSRRETVSNTIDQTLHVTDDVFFQQHFADLYEREWMNCPWNKLIRRSILTENGIRFPEKYSICEDMIFSVCVIRQCKSIVLLSGTYYKYCLRSTDSLVTKYHSHHFEALSEHYRLVSDYCAGYPSNAVVQNTIRSRYVSSSIAYIKRIVNAPSLSGKQKRKQIRSLLHDSLFCSVRRQTRNVRQKRVTYALVRMRATLLLYWMYTLQRKLHG